MSTRFLRHVARLAAASLIWAPGAAQAQGSASQADFSQGFISTVNKCLANGATVAHDTIDGYTRLELSADSTVPIGWDYRSELRHPLLRLFSGKSVTRALTLNATYSRHKVETSNTVASFSHKSSNKGYEWSSEVSNQRLITPYFRIDHDGTVKTSWKLALNKTYDTRALQDVMDVIKRATKLISPSSGLLTSLNADRFKDSSQFVDQSISSFLRESVDEIAPDEFPLAACAGQELVSLRLVLPQGANVVRHDPSARPVGTWTVRLSKPIRSIFAPPGSGALTPENVVANIGAGTIFDYQIADKLSLGQFLGGDTAISAVRDEFKATGAQPAVAAAKLCSLLVGKLQAVGLNRFDTAVAVRAFADQVLSAQSHREAILNPGNCAILGSAA